MASKTPSPQSPLETIDDPRDSKFPDTSRTTEPTSPATLTVVVLAPSTSLRPIHRFWHLLQHARTLIRLHGPYTTHVNTTVLARSPILRSTNNSKPPSMQLLATSFAAAQDAFGSAQPDGPAKEDLELFAALWKTAIKVVEQILEDGIPEGEAFGWGAYGLSGGYIPGFPTSSTSFPASSNNANFDDEFFPKNRCKPTIIVPKAQSTEQTAFEALRQRLRTALGSLPGVTDSQRGRSDEYTASIPGAERLGQLVRARKEVHFCGTLLVQVFREDEWRSVRWGHVIVVVERWLGNLELARGG
jgi:hypothetical protein